MSAIWVLASISSTSMSALNDDLASARTLTLSGKSAFDSIRGMRSFSGLDTPLGVSNSSLKEDLGLLGPKLPSDPSRHVLYRVVHDVAHVVIHLRDLREGGYPQGVQPPLQSHVYAVDLLQVVDVAVGLANDLEVDSYRLDVDPR